MALGLFMWVAWISLLLDSGAGVQTVKDGSFRPPPASQNLGGLEDDFDSLKYDEGAMEDAVNKLAESVYTSFNKPSAPKPQHLVPTGQMPSTPQSAPDLNRIVNGELRRWENKLFDPITFPLSGSNEMVAPPKPELPAIQLQSTPLSVHTSSKPDVPTPGHPTSYKPAQPSSPLEVSSPVFESWKPVSVPAIPSSHGAAGVPLGSQYTGSSLSGADFSNNVIFESGYPYSSKVDRPPVSIDYTVSSNAAEEWNKRPSMNEVPQSLTAVRYGLDNHMDTTGHTSAPWPSLKYPSVNSRPYEALPYAAEKYRQDATGNPQSPITYTHPKHKPSLYPSPNAVSDLSFSGAASDGQGNVGGMSSIAYASPPKKQFSQTAVKPETSFKGWMDVPSFSTVFGEGFPDLNQMDALPGNSVFNMRGSLPQKVYQMAPLKPLRKGFVVRTKNSYQRGRYLKSKTTYSPDITMSNMGTKAFKGPADLPKAQRKM